MDNSPRSNGPQVFSTEVGENKIDYKQRCKYLENQLEKFREQAAKVREVIGQKVRDSLECFVSCCRFMHAAIECAESCPCQVHVICFIVIVFTVFSAVSYNRVISKEIFSRSWFTSQLYVGMCVWRLIWIVPRDFLKFVHLITFQHFIQRDVYFERLCGSKVSLKLH